MTIEIRAIEPADSSILDQWQCAVADCHGAIGHFTNGDDESGYTVDFAPGWQVADMYFCADHGHIASEMTESCATHGQQMDDDNKCVECYVEDQAQRETDAYHAHLWATR